MWRSVVAGLLALTCAGQVLAREHCPDPAARVVSIQGMVEVQVQGRLLVD
jgi:archaeosine-15-forming tRNA-guanine transglycosylase